MKQVNTKMAVSHCTNKLANRFAAIEIKSLSEKKTDPTEDKRLIFLKRTGLCFLEIKIGHSLTCATILKA